MWIEKLQAEWLCSTGIQLSIEILNGISITSRGFQCNAGIRDRMRQEQTRNRLEYKTMSLTVSNLSHMGRPPGNSISWGWICIPQSSSRRQVSWVELREWCSTAYEGSGFMQTEGIDIKGLCCVLLGVSTTGWGAHWWADTYLHL